MTVRRTRKAELAALEQRLDIRFVRIENDLRWMKAIGSVIAGLLVLPLVRDLMGMGG